ncbi:hypothetical protein [Shimia sp.]|uniref:hypothetical protein n=1 Tax=Shimia sp. TaxID=1954381 RepID=UPI003B8EA858
MFWSRPLVSVDLADWIEDSFDWYEARFPTSKDLILPTAAFFTAKKGAPEDTAQQVLADIQRHLGNDMSLTLAPHAVVPAEYRHSYQSTGDVAGTFQTDGEDALITYDPELLQRPLSLINTLAHEVMHAQLHDMVADFPGGETAHELATDLGCIIAGFGAIQLQSADDIGWAGYLRQPTRAHALALFLHRRGQSIDLAKAHLSPRCQKLLRRAYKGIAS